MSDSIESLAEFSVARGCGFVMLGTGCLMGGLSFDPAMSLKAGATVTLIAALTLVVFASAAQRKPYRSTELWLLIPPDVRPPAAVAQAILSRALRAAYLRFALYFAAGSAGLFIVSILLTLRPAG